MLQQNVAEGIHRIEDAYTNWYIVEDGGALTIVPRAATADSERNLETIGSIADSGAGTVLTGHGEPWTGGAAEGVRLARLAGTS
jgi:hypothetical protein